MKAEAVNVSLFIKNPVDNGVEIQHVYERLIGFRKLDE